MCRTSVKRRIQQLRVDRPHGQKRKGNNCHQEDPPKKPTSVVFGKPSRDRANKPERSQ